MSKPLVTVLIDTYNHQSFIEDAINSVLRQDFPCVGNGDSCRGRRIDLTTVPLKSSGNLRHMYGFYVRSIMDRLPRSIWAFQKRAEKS